MPSTIQYRRDTLANWQSVNPVLADGEPGFITDAGEVRVGDGATAFVNLPTGNRYLSADGVFRSLLRDAAGWWLPPLGFPTNSGFTTTNERMYLVPFSVPYQITVDTLAVRVSSAGNTNAVVRLGIYDTVDAFPRNLVIDGGTVTADTTGDKELAVSQQIGPGMYWGAAAPQNAGTTAPDLFEVESMTLFNTPSFALLRTGRVPAVDAVSGALPATIAAGSGNMAFTSLPVIGFRRS